MAKINLGTNWIRDLYYDPCDPNPWILVELAFPALIQAIWEYIQCDWEDYIEHGTGKSRQKRLKNQLRANKWQPPKAISKGVMFLSLAEAGIQRLGWMFLVAEIAAGAFIRWSSLVMSLPECNVEVTSTWGRSESPIDGRGLSFEWGIGPSWTLEEGTMFPYIHADFTIPAGGAAYYTTFQRYANFITGEELKVSTRLVRSSDNRVVNQADENDPADKLRRSSALHGRLKNNTPGPVGYRFEVRLSPGQFPLVWQCIGDFCSLRIYEAHEVIHAPMLPYVALEQPRRRHAQKRKKAPST